MSNTLEDIIYRCGSTSDIDGDSVHRTLHITDIEAMTDIDKVRLALALLESTTAVFGGGDPTAALLQWLESNTK